MTTVSIVIAQSTIFRVSLTLVKTRNYTIRAYSLMRKVQAKLDNLQKTRKRTAA